MDQKETAQELLDRAATVHFVGIGGIGMSGLAELLIQRGKKVTGSDVKGSPMIDHLRELGARVSIGHAAEAVVGADLVVATSAARSENPELEEARRRGLPLVKRAEMLGWLMKGSHGIAIAGTHGKTTTTGMVAYLLYQAGMEPTALIGGEPLNFPSHGLLGRGPHLVAEADEYDRSFLQLWPRIAVITSVEADHLDCYADLEDITNTFKEFASRIPEDGLLVTNNDDPILRRMKLAVPRQSYGFRPGADWQIVECEPTEGFGTRFVFMPPSGGEYSCELQLAGEHYAMNALAAIAVAGAVGIKPARAIEILRYFRGIKRRFQKVGEAGGVIVVDDYAHHPTAVRGTLAAARERHRGAIWCVFQPHTSNRTERLLEEFAAAFGHADHVLMLPVYHPAGREVEKGATSDDLVAAMAHPDVRGVAGMPGALAVLEAEVFPGDLVITMGAGDVHQLGPMLLGRLGGRKNGWTSQS